MPRALRNLIWASGNAGTAGQSFRNHVLGAASGARMSDYVIGTMMTSGYPTDPWIALPSVYTFSLDVVFTGSGPRVHHIQQNAAAAYTFWHENMAGGGATMPAVDVMGFTSYGGGSQHALSVRLTAPAAGSINVVPLARLLGPMPPGDDEWPAEFEAAMSAGGSAGTFTFNLMMEYKPDIGQFNPWLHNGTGWPMMQNLREWTSSDLDFRWWRTAYTGTVWERAGSSPFSTSRIAMASVGNFFTDADQPAEFNVIGVNSTGPWARAWLEWKPKEHTNWNTAGMIGVRDTRQPM
jgi:hypothetical protein